MKNGKGKRLVFYMFLTFSGENSLKTLLKKMILTSKRRPKHPIAGQKTQQLTGLSGRLC